MNGRINSTETSKARIGFRDKFPDKKILVPVQK